MKREKYKLKRKKRENKKNVTTKHWDMQQLKSLITWIKWCKVFKTWVNSTLCRLEWSDKRSSRYAC